MKTDATTRAEKAQSALIASIARVTERMNDPKAAVPTLGTIMTEPTTTTAAAGLLAKLLPAGIGAGLMVLVDPPQSKRELFLRLFAGMGCSFLFTGTVLDLLHSFALFAFLDKANHDHRMAVAGALGAVGWFVLGAAAMLLKKFRADPVATVEEVKKVV
jgi:hypothetical protein